MLRFNRATFFILFSFVAYANSRPYQYLPEIPDYIPVYIRYGNQPLEEINPALAEAFHETSSLSKNIQDLSDKNDVSLDSKEENIAGEKPLPPVVPVGDALDEESNFPKEEKRSEKDSVVMKLQKLDKLAIERLQKELKKKVINK